MYSAIFWKITSVRVWIEDELRGDVVAPPKEAAIVCPIELQGGPRLKLIDFVKAQSKK